MIVSFSGDAFLVRRAARAYLRGQGFAVTDVAEMADEIEPEGIAQAAAQGGLFGRTALLLDFDAAFQGQAGVKPRNDALKALASVSDDSVVVVLDSGATNARQKTLRSLGEHHHEPTPRFGALTRWISDELARHDVRTRGDVPGTMAELFGDDLPAIAAEVRKLAVLDEELTSDRVREIANRPAARDAFDLIDAAVAGDAETALRVCRTLLDQGEAPPRIMGALAWQFDVVAMCVGLLQIEGSVRPQDAARRLKANPYAVKKALAIATGLGEGELRRSLDTLLTADVGMKSGRDAAATMELCTVELAGIFAR